MANKILTVKEMVDGGSYAFIGQTGNYDKNKLVTQSLFRSLNLNITCEYLGYNNITGSVPTGYVFLIRNSVDFVDDLIDFYYELEHENGSINGYVRTTWDGQGDDYHRFFAYNFGNNNYSYSIKTNERIIVVPFENSTPPEIVSFKITRIVGEYDIIYKVNDTTTNLTQDTQYIGVLLTQYVYISSESALEETFDWVGNIKTEIEDSSSQNYITSIDGDITYQMNEEPLTVVTKRFYIYPREMFEYGTLFMKLATTCTDSTANASELPVTTQLTVGEYSTDPSNAVDVLYDQTSTVYLSTNSSNTQPFANYLTPVRSNCSSVKLYASYSITKS